MKGVTYGCDPEVFVSVAGAVIPCVGRMPGTKVEPVAVEKSKYGLKVQEDGVTLEFNIDPVDSIKKFTNNVAGAVDELVRYTRKIIGAGANLEIKAAHEFRQEDLTTDQANTFGCDPDFNAWERGVERIAPSVKEVGLNRFAGGHIHFGYNMDDAGLPPWALIQFIEIMGYGRVIEYDVQGARRAFYGRPGLFRIKPYGVEYRTPSNFWVQDSNYIDYLCYPVEVVLQRPERARVLYKKIQDNQKALYEALLSGKRTDIVRRIGDELTNSFSKADVEREF